MQLAILLSLIVWSFINPTQNLALLITVGLIIAIASATQDITVDALRIEQINENEGKAMAAGAAMAVVGWWTGYKLGGVVALFTAEYFENMGIADYWQATFLVLGVVIILMNIGLMFVHEPIETNRQAKQRENDKLIKEKVLEEINELIEAVEQNSNKIHEAADVFYHLIIYLESNNIKIEDIMLELEKRKK